MEPAGGQAGEAATTKVLPAGSYRTAAGLGVDGGLQIAQAEGQIGPMVIGGWQGAPLPRDQL